MNGAGQLPQHLASIYHTHLSDNNVFILSYLGMLVYAEPGDANSGMYSGMHLRRRFSQCVDDASMLAIR